MFDWFEKRQRSALLETPFPEAWRAHLAQHAPFYARLAEEDRARLEDLTRIFVAEKTFIGAGGLEVTDEIRVVIAASAVRLVLHTNIDAFDRLQEIVVYPGAFLRPEVEDVFLGEAHAWGVVVLSWASVRAGLRSQRDGRDVTLHEMAHVLDRADGSFDGTPELSAGEDYRPWAKVMSQHFLRLRKDRAPENRVLDRYGATNEAEFFAVATEAYFERPAELKAGLPDLYEELEKFYRGQA
jgi:Mlc titration factor MtfA (ptsG expression regulator)